MTNPPGRGRLPRRRNGQTLAELAIVAPFLLLMLGIIVDFGFYINDYLGVHSGVRLATLAAMQGRGSPGTSGSKPTPVFNSTQLITFIQEGHGAVAQVQPSEITVTYCCTSGGASTTAYSSVTKPDSAWGNANASATFDATDDYVGVTILVQHVHRFLLPIYWGTGGSLTIKAQAKVYVVPGFAP